MNEAEKINELKKQERCSLPPVKPHSFICSLLTIPSWTYDAKAGKCLSYQYGGCGKTANLFESQDECKAACARDLSKKHAPLNVQYSIPHFKITNITAKEKSLQGVCRYRNVSYYAGQEIVQINKDDGCKTDCVCERSDNQ